jgi:hypothetical protein
MGAMTALRLVLAASAAAVLAPLVPAAPALAAGRVLVVGDSLEVGTGPYLRKELAGSSVQVDARIGRPSGEGVRVLRSLLRRSDEVVVFDLGVNDDPSQPGRLAGDLEAARSLAGDRCLVVATVSGPPVNGVPVDGLNRVIRRFAASTPTAQLVDWHAAAAENPGLLNRDRLHPGPAGYALRGRLVAEGVQSCGSSGPSPSRHRRARPGTPAPLDEGALDVPWSNAALLTPYGVVSGYVLGVVGVVETAEQEVRAVLTPGRSEPVLGAP